MASDNSTLAASEISAANVTESLVANQAFTEKLANLPAILWDNGNFFFFEGRIIFTAMACIYLGSQAALRRPPSANPAKKGKKGGRKDQDKEDELVQGLVPSDAILLPIMAGAVLTSLYYLIKWLDDPEILNKILRAYFSIMSLVAMGKLLADLLHYVTGFVFPTVWLAKNGRLYHIDSSKKGQWSVNDNSTEQVWDKKKKSPFPYWWSELNASDATNNLLWEIRHLLTEEWTIRFSVHGITNQKFKVKFNDILGIVLAIHVNIAYFMTQSTFLSNLMGYSFCYTGIMLLSPTTFATGTAVLFGLFFYDIYMVFYTPYMVTVATKLDVPIKLIFDGPARASMLGLGDIVLPGIFVGLCLRFDLYMYYYRQRKFVPVELKSKDETSGQVVTNTETQRMVVKPDYINPQGQWGDWFWSTRFGKLSANATPALKATTFPKPYFYAALVGYLLAMIVTLVILIVYHHAQPALLYLVPGVVSATWTTGLFRGELREMWGYTEDGSLDTADTIVEVDGDGNVVSVVKNKVDAKDKKGDDSKNEDEAKDKKDDGKEDTQAGDNVFPDTQSITKDVPSNGEADDNNETSPDKNESSIVEKKVKGYSVFLFSIEVPAPSEASDS
ncbi:signal peptide peptidase-domain-containing protein [Daldinia caldariorum]|uniref:signal peptide peptidase-domain-containing protein n=1 Tax=Daldinia caldariorum TaxID=326644 RepID=UPI00200796A2|nr:signal peptide peptidase-domain-containing protein [Daldinia caldariorum]KAI1472441.1 signal peptide peptidase-domain-containing protein [Daldinia caldariorum]